MRGGGPFNPGGGGGIDPFNIGGGGGPFKPGGGGGIHPGVGPTVLEWFP